MTLQDKLQEWINNGQNYWQGFALLQQHGKNKSLLKHLAKGPTQYNSDKLAHELKKMAQLKQLPKPQKKKGDNEGGKQKQQPQPQPSEPQPQQNGQKPQVISELEGYKNKLFKEMSDLHSRLTEVKDEQKRGEMALQILNYEDRLQETWGQLDDYRDHGKLPEQTNGNEVNVNNLQKELNNNRAYISKNKNRPGKEEEVKNREQRNEQIEKMLNDG